MKKILSLLIFGALSLSLGAQNYLVLDLADTTGPVISKHIYGHFSEHLGRCIYEGYWVGQDQSIENKNGIRQDVVSALREVNIPNLRWPGGCFADTYHWKDGIGTSEERATIINTHWGGVTEDNSFGTHEFMELCSQLGTDAFISGNMGSGSVQEMAQWVEYLTSANESPMTKERIANGRKEPWKVAFWGLGNEPWGCGGNMDAEQYADLMRQYSTYCRDYSGNILTRVACSSYGTDASWTEVLMSDQQTRNMFQGLSTHYYSFARGWGDKGNATGFKEKDWFDVMKTSGRMLNVLEAHERVMDKYDPQKRIGLYVDEWGNWYNPEPGSNPGFLYQQNSLRDAVTAANTLNLFNNHADRVKGANLAQTVNVLQALILTDGSKMIKTPSFYVFKLMKVHQEARLLKSKLISEDYHFDGEAVPAISASASVNSQGVYHISISNCHPVKEMKVHIDLLGKAVKVSDAQMISGDAMDAHNSFENPDRVTASKFKSYTLINGDLEVNLPSKSVVVIELK